VGYRLQSVRLVGRWWLRVPAARRQGLHSIQQVRLVATWWLCGAVLCRGLMQGYVSKLLVSAGQGLHSIQQVRLAGLGTWWLCGAVLCSGFMLGGSN
jgi:hypothetical protein